MNQLVSLGTAVQFLTRLPVGKFSSGDASALAASTRYFPLVGFFVGVCLCFSFRLLQLVLPDSVAIVLMLLIGIRLTGALHEDGLADVADSAGAFNREQKLAIMRDSRVGTYGSLALVLLVLVKFAALQELAGVSLVACLSALLAAHCLSRWSSVWLLARVDYVRPSADNKAVADGVTNTQLMESSVCLLLVFLPLAWWSTPAVYLLLPVAWLVVSLCALHFKRSFGGITGDCIGAANQLVELSIYLTVLVAVFNGGSST